LNVDGIAQVVPLPLPPVALLGVVPAELAVLVAVLERPPLLVREPPTPAPPDAPPFA
jgi:hypothetical protein